MFRDREATLTEIFGSAPVKSLSKTDCLTGVNYYNLTLGENEKDWSHLSNTDSFTPAPKTRVLIDWKKTF